MLAHNTDTTGMIGRHTSERFRGSAEENVEYPDDRVQDYEYPDDSHSPPTTPKRRVLIDDERDFGRNDPVGTKELTAAKKPSTWVKIRNRIIISTNNQVEYKKRCRGSRLITVKTSFDNLDDWQSCYENIQDAFREHIPHVEFGNCGEVIVNNVEQFTIKMPTRPRPPQEQCNAAIDKKHNPLQRREFPCEPRDVLSRSDSQIQTMVHSPKSHTPDMDNARRKRLFSELIAGVLASSVDILDQITKGCITENEEQGAISKALVPQTKKVRISPGSPGPRRAVADNVRQQVSNATQERRIPAKALPSHPERDVMLKKRNSAGEEGVIPGNDKEREKYANRRPKRYRPDEEEIIDDDGSDDGTENGSYDN